MDYIQNFIQKYRNTIPSTREEEFQMATIQAFEQIWAKLKEIEKKVNYLG
ncbi:MAG: hypothetical protein ACFFCE_16715 [Promethearchaeota archaeon]